jgi:hypothetical protein
VSALVEIPSPPVAPPFGVGALTDAELREWLTAFRAVGDPLADALVERFRELPGGQGWALLDGALTAGPGAPADGPPELRDLIAAASHTPAWLDLDVVDRGGISFWRAGYPAITLALLYGSLAFGYQYGDLARPLAATGRLDRMARRRVGETARWVLAVTTPGGLAPGADGWRASLRVRIVHALVRRRLLDSPDWPTAEWGVPISATAMMATAVGGFDVMPQRALADLGIPATPAERDARTALWRWVAYVMGVPEQLLPASWDEAERLMAAYATLDHGPNPDGPELIRALTHNALPIVSALPEPYAAPARRLLTPVVEAMVRRWLGDEAADRLELPPRRRAARVLPLTRPAMRAGSRLASSRLLGDEPTATRRQIAFVDRVLDLTGQPARPVSPAETSRS